MKFLVLFLFLLCHFARAEEPLISMEDAIEKIGVAKFISFYQVTRTEDKKTVEYTLVQFSARPQGKGHETTGMTYVNENMFHFAENICEPTTVRSDTAYSSRTFYCFTKAQVVPSPQLSTQQ